MQAFRIGSALGIVVATLVACSGGGGSSSGGVGGGDVNSFIDEFCNTYAPCCGQANKPTDGVACKQTLTLISTKDAYNPSMGSACLTDVRARSRASDFRKDPTKGSKSCKDVFKAGGSGGGGTKAPGEACSSSSDCASQPDGDVSCATAYANGATTKACQVQITGGKEGDKPCLGTIEGSTRIYESYTSGTSDAGAAKPPERGYFCDLANGVYCDAKASVCTKVKKGGEACTGYGAYECEKTTYCDYAQKKCVARLAVGSDCSTNPQACVAEARCDLQGTKKCVALLADGADCKMGTECESRSCTNAKCGSSAEETMALFCGK